MTPPATARAFEPAQDTWPPERIRVQDRAAADVWRFRSQAARLLRSRTLELEAARRLAEAVPDAPTPRGRPVQH